MRITDRGQFVAIGITSAVLAAGAAGIGAHFGGRKHPVSGAMIGAMALPLVSTVIFLATSDPPDQIGTSSGPRHLGSAGGFP